MDCPNCKAAVAAGQQYCGACGLPLSSDGKQIVAQVEKVLATRFKERELVEYEITEKVIGRFESLLKLARWILTPILSLLALAIAIAVFFGFKSYSDATSAIKVASDVAIDGLKKQSEQTKLLLQAETEKSQKVLQGYADNPQLKANAQKAEQALRAVDSHAKAMEQRVGGVLQLADDREKRLRDIDVIRSTNPNATVSSLDAILSRPTEPFNLNTIRGLNAMPTETLTIGSKGDEVSQVQKRLKELDCYTGDITGNFDEATYQAVRTFNAVKDYGTGWLGVSITGQRAINPVYVTLSKGDVDILTWFHLFPASGMIGMSHCPK